MLVGTPIMLCSRRSFIGEPMTQLYTKPRPKFKARTIKEIKGNCIETIPTGIEFEVYELNTMGYATCEGLGVNSIWKNEYEIIDEKEQEHGNQESCYR